MTARRAAASLQAPHSAITPLALIVLAHLATSLSKNFCKYSGDLRSGATRSAPIFFICSRVAGLFIAATVASLSLRTIAAGVALGSATANQVETSKSVRPCSCAEARSGPLGELLRVRTAIALMH